MSDYEFSIEYTDPNEQPSQAMHFKAAASYAAQIVRDSANYTFTQMVGPKWEYGITIWLRTYPVAKMNSFGKVSYDEVICGGDEYPAVMYILQAIKNARAEVQSIYNQEMTPTEVESELSLKPGVVRKYIHDHRESLLADRYIRYADRRTILIKRGIAMSRWGHSGEKHWQESTACGLMANGTIDDSVWQQIVNLHYDDTPSVETKFGRYFRTRTVLIGDFSGYVERVESEGHDTYYRVYSAKNNAYFADADMEVRRINDRYAVNYRPLNYRRAIKLRILEELGVMPSG
jgi:hypothetical protein